MSTEVVGYDRTDGLATITLHRPRASNALDRALKEQLVAAVRVAGADPAVRAVLLVAEGKNFCVGQDLAEHAASLDADPAHAMDTVAEHYNPLITALAQMAVPVVVGVNGACVGAGLGIALAGDIRIVGESAKFSTAFTGIGLACDSGLSNALARMLGTSRAAGLLLLGDRFTAAEALDWGLVHRVVPDENLLDAATVLARRLASGPTLAYTKVKELIGAGGATLSAALVAEQRAQVALGASEDHQQAVAAFLDKRPVTFTGS